MKLFFGLAVLSLTTFSAFAKDVFIDDVKVEEIARQLYLSQEEVQARTIGLTFKDSHSDYYHTRRLICTAAELENCDKFRFVDTAFFNDNGRPERVMVLNEEHGPYNQAEVRNVIENFSKKIEETGVYSDDGSFLWNGTEIGFTVAHEMWVQCGNVCEIPAAIVFIPVGFVYDIFTAPYHLVKNKNNKKKAKQEAKKINNLIAEGKPAMVELNLNQMRTIEQSMDAALKETK